MLRFVPVDLVYASHFLHFEFAFGGDANYIVRALFEGIIEPGWGSVVRRGLHSEQLLSFRRGGDLCFYVPFDLDSLLGRNLEFLCRVDLLELGSAGVEVCRALLLVLLAGI